MQVNGSHVLASTVVVVLIAVLCNEVVGRRVTLQPMSGREVYNALRAAGRTDAVPEGRIITHGIAAATGFTVGLLKGIGGTVLLDWAAAANTSALTSSGFNLTSLTSGGLNLTALTSLFSGTKNNATTQEICFTTRSLDADDDSSADRDFNGGNNYNYNVNYDDYDNDDYDSDAGNDDEDAYDGSARRGRQSVTTSTDPVATTATSPTTPVTNIDSVTSTSTSPSVVNCIILQS